MGTKLRRRALDFNSHLVHSDHSGREKKHQPHRRLRKSREEEILTMAYVIPFLNLLRTSGRQKACEDGNNRPRKHLQLTTLRRRALVRKSLKLTTLRRRALVYSVDSEEEKKTNRWTRKSLKLTTLRRRALVYSVDSEEEKKHQPHRILHHVCQWLKTNLWTR